MLLPCDWISIRHPTSSLDPPGRPSPTSHEGLGVTDDEWDIFARHTVTTLNEMSIPEQEKSEFLAVAERLKPDIVEISRRLEP